MPRTRARFLAPLAVAGVGLLGTAALARDSPSAPGDLIPAGLAVDASPNGGSSNGNSVLEAGETVIVAPSWLNTRSVPANETGGASAFGGPGAATLYTVPDPQASYMIIASQAGSCAATGDCYALAVATATPRPAAHWDATFGEGTTGGSFKTWTVHVGDSYSDVPRTNIFYRFIETLLHHGVTGGCATPDGFCPVGHMTREWMAPFVLLAKEGRFYSPPACQYGTEMFRDLLATNPNCGWVEELARRGVVTGCGNGFYCPDLVVSREQMAVFILATKEGPSYAPPPCVAGTETFQDMPASSPFCPWVEELVRRNVVAGCGNGNYCPTLHVSREQMSVFLSVTFGLELYGVRPYAYLVNTTNDVDDGACTPAHCSLREAINAANASPDPPGAREEIHFRIAGTGTQTIRPTTALPAVRGPVVVDGYTQPGARPNTQTGGGLDSVLQVELDLGARTGVVAQGSRVLLRGLAVTRAVGDGITLEGTQHAVEGCYVGIDATGVAARPNERAGIATSFLSTSDNRIGGTLPAQRNVISGNANEGVFINVSSRNVVQGNLIGTDRSGFARVGNGTHGIRVYATIDLMNALANVIGGAAPGAGNVISANGSAIYLEGLVSPVTVSFVNQTVIAGNTIGYTADGVTPLPNNFGIILIGRGVLDTVIGQFRGGNVITASASGIDFYSDTIGGPQRTRVHDNTIRDARDGIRGVMSASDIAYNTIGPNSGTGILLTGGSANIQANSIAGNTALGIDLAPAGVTPNDPGDADTGPNGLQNFPVITAATSSHIAHLAVVSGTISSAPNSTYRIEVFVSPVAHASGYGEGQSPLSATTVTTDAAGIASFAAGGIGPVPNGSVATATATDAAGNTSEFSAALPFVQTQ